MRRIYLHPQIHSSIHRDLWSALDETTANLPDEDAAFIRFLSTLETSRFAIVLEVVWMVLTWLMDGAEWALRLVPLPVRFRNPRAMVWRVQWLGWTIDWSKDGERWLMQKDVRAAHAAGQVIAVAPSGAPPEVKS